MKKVWCAIRFLWLTVEMKIKLRTITIKDNHCLAPHSCYSLTELRIKAATWNTIYELGCENVFDWSLLKYGGMILVVHLQLSSKEDLDHLYLKDQYVSRLLFAQNSWMSLMKAGERDRSAVRTTWLLRAAVIVALEVLVVGGCAVRAVSYEKMSYSLVPVGQSRHVSVHSIQLDLCSYCRQLPFLCGREALTLSGCLKAYDLLTK